MMRHINILLDLTREDIVRWRINTERQHHQLLIYLIVVDSRVEIGEVWTLRNRLQTLREFPYFSSIVVLFDVFSRAGNSYAIEHFKEIKIEGSQKSVRSTILRIQFTPGIERSLGLTENFINRFGSIQLIINQRWITLVWAIDFYVQKQMLKLHRVYRQVMSNK